MRLKRFKELNESNNPMENNKIFSVRDLDELHTN